MSRPVDSRSELPSSMLPFPPEGNPKRQHEKFQIQPEVLLLDIEAVQSELLPARNIPRRVDLCNAREPRPNLLTHVIARDLLQRDRLARSADFHLSRQ